MHNWQQRELLEQLSDMEIGSSTWSVGKSGNNLVDF